MSSKPPLQFWDTLKKNAVNIVDGYHPTNVGLPSVKPRSRIGKLLKWSVYFLVVITILFVVSVQIAEWIWFIPWDSYITGGIFSTEYLEKSLKKARKYPELYKTVMITKYSVYSIYMTIFILSGILAIIKTKYGLGKGGVQNIITLLWRSGAKG